VAGSNSVAAAPGGARYVRRVRPHPRVVIVGGGLRRACSVPRLCATRPGRPLWLVDRHQLPTSFNAIALSSRELPAEPVGPSPAPLRQGVARAASEPPLTARAMSSASTFERKFVRLRERPSSCPYDYLRARERAGVTKLLRKRKGVRAHQRLGLKDLGSGTSAPQPRTRMSRARLRAAASDDDERRALGSPSASSVVDQTGRRVPRVRSPSLARLVIPARVPRRLPGRRYYAFSLFRRWRIGLLPMFVPRLSEYAAGASSNVSASTCRYEHDADLGRPPGESCWTTAPEVETATMGLDRGRASQTIRCTRRPERLLVDDHLRVCRYRGRVRDR